MHSSAYPYGTTICSAWGWIFGGLGGLLKPQRSGLFRTLDMDFAEFPFHALR
jgi:hypothetical protein